MRTGRLLWLTVLAVLAAGGLAACGNSDSGSGASAASSSAPASTPSNDVVAQAKAALAKNYAGTDRALPSSAPKPPAHQRVWIIACSTSAPGCNTPAQGAAEAAKALGWQAKVVDGKVTPSVYNALIHQAIAAKADGIILVAVDCALVKGSIQDAQKAGIKIVGLYALDCDDKYGGGGKPLFEGQPLFKDGMTYGAYIEGPWAQSMVDYAIAKTGGKVNAILMRDTSDAIGRHIADGIQTAIGRCSRCKLTSVQFTGEDLVGGKLQAKAQTALTQNREANVLFGSYDAAMALGIAAGVEASGRGNQVLALGLEGLAPNIQLIKAGKGQNFAAGAPDRWIGWATVDSLIRALDGEKSVDEGIGLQSIDRQHNIPADTPYYDGNVDTSGKPKQDYEANYRKIWGIG